MSIRAVLFDLDGTLLPMDQDQFVGIYFSRLSKKLAPYGYEPQALIESIWKGTEAMVRNDGSVTNEEAFWCFFTSRFGEEARSHLPIFDEYYRKEFLAAQEACGFEPRAAELVRSLRRRGIRTILATNPIFPAVATQNRIRWAGLAPEDFEHCTTYENSRFCKPNPDYYRQLLQELALYPEECLMVGNDVEEDMIARTLGTEVFLLTDCLLNKRSRDITQYPHGGFSELAAVLEALPERPE